MATKKKVSLTVQQRLEVLKDLETLSVSTVAAKYNVHHMTIRRIKVKSASIAQFAEKNKRFIKRHRLTKPTYEELEQHLLSWYLERKSLGDIMSDAILLGKAIELKETMASSSSFKVSKGWLAKFKQRNNIRLVHVYQENVAADEDYKNSLKTFVNDFNRLIQKENISLDCVYNMHDSGLLWKALPIKTVSGEDEECISGYKLRKERVTIGLCVNATGTHKIMPLVIYKYDTTTAVKNAIDKLPVIFKSQHNALMDEPLFSDWYNNYFKPSVRNFQLENDIHSKVLLLLDNCAGNKIPVNSEDNFEIKYLPTNTTGLVQPMLQGIIEKTKQGFRHRLMRSVVNSLWGINEFYQTYTIKDCIEMILASWKEITIDDIRNAWNKIIEKPTFQEERTLDEIQELMSTISDQNLNREETSEFLKICSAEENKNSITHEDRDEDRKVDIKEEKDEDWEDDWEDDWDDGWAKDDKKEDIKKEMADDRDNEGPRNRGISLNQSEREELEYIFQRLQYYKPRLPQSTQLHIDGIQLSILGKTKCNSVLIVYVAYMILNVIEN